jgi:hypothetical protein
MPRLVEYLVLWPESSPLMPPSRYKEDVQAFNLPDRKRRRNSTIQISRNVVDSNPTAPVHLEPLSVIFTQYPTARNRLLANHVFLP